MTPSDWNALQKEAYAHGRTQEQLYVAVQALRQIVEICEQRKHRSGYRLLEVEMTAGATLRQLSTVNGGVINDTGTPK